jgi:predicted nucleic acid-binding protein
MMRPSPAAQVLSWMAKHSPSRLFTTAVTQAEILYGLEMLPKGKRRTALKLAIEAMFEHDFAGRILPFDSEAARAFSIIAGHRRALGRPIASMDAQIASIAHSRGASIASRNASDFEACGVEVLNPWREFATKTGHK